LSKGDADLANKLVQRRSKGNFQIAGTMGNIVCFENIEIQLKVLLFFKYRECQRCYNSAATNYYFKTKPYDFKGY